MLLAKGKCTKMRAMSLLSSFTPDRALVFPPQRSPLLLLLPLSRFSRVGLCATPSLGFSRQKHWSGLPLPSPMHENEKWKWSRSVASTLRDPMNCSLPGSSIHGIFQARVLEWVAIAFTNSVSRKPIFSSGLEINTSIIISTLYPLSFLTSLKEEWWELMRK